MAVSCDARFTTPAGPQRADELAAAAPKRGWQRLSAGEGSKGHRLYNWLLIDPGADQHLLLVRRSISKPSELAYYICRSNTPVPLAELVRITGSRWAVEETFQFAKTRPAWTTTKSAATTPDTATSPCPCSPPHSSPLPPTPNETTIKKGHHNQRQAPDPAVLQRNPTPVGHPDPPQPPPSPHRPLVPLATTHQTRARTCHYQRQHHKHHKMRL
jgi:hypothetical protein